MIRSPAFHSSHRLPYLQSHDSPHVSPSFQTTNRFRCSSLDPSASPFLTRNAAASPPARSVNQSTGRSVHSQAPHAGRGCPFTKTKRGKKQKKQKNKTQGGISNGEKRDQRNRWEQSVSLGSVCVCVAEQPARSLESGSLSCAAHVGRARE